MGPFLHNAGVYFWGLINKPKKRNMSAQEDGIVKCLICLVFLKEEQNNFCYHLNADMLICLSDKLKLEP